MIWTLRVECICGLYLEEECVREIEIDSETSLLELHEAIQDAVDFDRDHLFEFYAGRNWRNRKVVYADALLWEEMFETYAGIPLEAIYPLPKSCKLYYLFDFGDSWYFEIRKSRKKPGISQEGAVYPRVIEKIGPNPPQYGRYDDDPEF